jgi:hypothetical protein
VFCEPNKKKEKKMKKVMRIAWWTVRIILILVVVYVVFNQFDIGEFKSKFSKDDLPPVPFDTNNGYYLMMTLAESPETDIMSETVVMKYRKLFDPKYDNKKYLAEWDSEEYKKPFQNDLEYIRSVLRKAIGSGNNWIDGFTDLEFDWNQAVLDGKKDILEVKTRWAVYLDRYQRLIDTEVYEEFSPVYPVYVTPHLLSWLQVARVYIVVNMLDALDGNWDKGVRNLLAHLDFTKRCIRGSRLIINNLVGKAMARNTMSALVSLMNHEEFPKEIYRTVLDGMPPASMDDFGSRKSYTFELLAFTPMEGWTDLLYKDLNGFNRFIVRLFFQENRTRKLIHDYASTFLRLEQTPPYRWDSQLGKQQEDYHPPLGFLWWLQNPAGKMAAKESLFNGLAFVVKSYQAKTLYDLTRMSAELHLEYDPNKPVPETLKKLETYKTPDPATGKPYAWHEQKQRLYSFGTDRDDDDGKMDYRNPLDSDFAIPVILYVK